MSESERPIANPAVEALGKAEAALVVLRELLAHLDLPEDKKSAIKAAISRHMSEVQTKYDNAPNLEDSSRRATTIQFLGMFINLLNED